MVPLIHSSSSTVAGTREARHKDPVPHMWAVEDLPGAVYLLDICGRAYCKEG
jgi:hypothetical protein